MTTYKNGTGNVLRLPDRVVDTLIDSAGVSRAAPGRTASTVSDQTAQVERLVHDTCEELLARLPTDDAQCAARWRLMMKVAHDADSEEAELMEELSQDAPDTDEIDPIFVEKIVDQAIATLAARRQEAGREDLS